MIHLRSLVSLLVAATASCSPSPPVDAVSAAIETPAETAAAAKNALSGMSLAFTSAPDGNHDIYLLSPDGTKKRLTKHPASDAFPSWSPDGKRIAFTSNREGESELYVMDADGSNSKRLTHLEHDTGTPAWSPDGKTIAFDYVGGTDEASIDGVTIISNRIFLIDADGANLRPLHDKPAILPAWSPDGSRIAYCGLPHIWTVNPDGSNPKQITSSEAGEMCPAWSPDGRRIAFVSARGIDPPTGHFMDLYVMDAAGSNIRRLTNLKAQCLMPAWSPDGRRIIFYANFFSKKQGREEATADLFVISADGSNLTRLTKNQYDDYGPVIRPPLRKGVPVRVTGIVKHRGKPVPKARVAFHTRLTPVIAIGVTDEDGKFALSTYSVDDGALPGDYVVVIYTTEATGLPEEYANKETSDLRKTVPAQYGPHHFEFLLEE